MFICAAYIVALARLQCNKCFFCGATMLWASDKPQVDARMYRSRMMTVDRILCHLAHVAGNCVLSCLHCNCSRKDKTVDSFADAMGSDATERRAITLSRRARGD